MRYILDMPSNASDTVFGFEFQVYAGIYLMLQHLGDMENLKIEGPSEDIELKLSNGTTIYAQAKAFTKPYDAERKACTQKLTHGLRSLSAVNDPRAYQLVYITNLQIPIVDTLTTEFDGSYYLKYSELSECSRQAIDGILERNQYTIDLEKLTFVAFPFFGQNTDQKLKIIVRAIREMLHKIDSTLEGAAPALTHRWCSIFLADGAFKSGAICVSVEDITWDLIFEGIRKMGNDGIRQALSLDESTFDEAIQEYDSIIQFEGSQFKTCNAILQMYGDYCTKNGFECDVGKFVVEMRDEIFRILFGDRQSDGGQELLMVCAQVIAYKVLRRRGFVKRIKQGIKRYGD